MAAVAHRATAIIRIVRYRIWACCPLRIQRCVCSNFIINTICCSTTRINILRTRTILTGIISTKCITCLNWFCNCSTLCIQTRFCLCIRIVITWILSIKFIPIFSCSSCRSTLVIQCNFIYIRFTAYCICSSAARCTRSIKCCCCICSTTLAVTCTTCHTINTLIGIIRTTYCTRTNPRSFCAGTFVIFYI